MYKFDEFSLVDLVLTLFGAKYEVYYFVQPYLNHFINIMLVQLTWTGPPALACYARTGWDTSPASLAPNTLTVLLNTT